MSSWQVYRKLLPFLRPHGGAAVGAAVFMLLGALLQLPAPLLTRYLFDRVLPSGNVRLLTGLVLVLVGLLIVGSSVSLLQTHFLLKCRYGVERAMRHAALARCLGSRWDVGDGRASGYLLSRLDDDIAQIQHLLLDPLLALLLQGLTLTAGVVLLFHLHARMAWVALGSLPLFWLVLTGFSRRIQAWVALRQERWAQFRGRLQEGLAQVPSLQANLLQQAFLHRVDGACGEALRTSRRTELIQTLASTLVGLTGAALPVFVLWYGIREILLGRFTVGGFMAFNTSVGYLFGPARALAALRLDLQAARASAERVLEMLELPEASADYGTQPLKVFSSLEVRDLAFQYEDGRGLAPISFRLERGTSLAVVGETGCGKSTLVKLLLGLRVPERGRVYVNGQDVRDWSLESLRAQIGYVPQDPELFEGSLLENLSRFEAAPDRAWVDELLRWCALKEVVERFPRGLDTNVREAGRGLSGGEKQRVALARALYGRPGLLILDEATSAMDPGTEDRVLSELSNLPWKPALLFVTHRHQLLTRFDAVLEVARPS